jgi:hypothetical protein
MRCVDIVIISLEAGSREKAYCTRFSILQPVIQFRNYYKEESRNDICSINANGLQIFCTGVRFDAKCEVIAMDLMLRIMSPNNFNITQTTHKTDPFTTSHHSLLATTYIIGIVRFDADLQTKMRSNHHAPSHYARKPSYHNNSQNEFPAVAEHSNPFPTLHPPLLS